MNKTLIIAEAGVNHNGKIELAKKLVKIASDSGADIVKFQSFNADEIATERANQTRYQKENMNNILTQKEMLKNLELKPEEWLELREFCEELKIEFLSTAFDFKNISMLEKFNLQRFKIPSGEITNYPYLEKVGSFNKPIILSTGMANLDEIQSAIDVLERSGTLRKKITILHCTTEYPAPIEEVNLNALKTLRNVFSTEVGYSDHTLGIEVAIAAVALGASIIEKHFTVDRNLSGPDHKASLEPLELSLMIKSIRAIEKALGDGIKKPTKSEKLNLHHVRKSLVAAVDIQKGDKFSKENLTSKRPGDGLSPMLWPKFIGKISLKDFKKDDQISW